MECMTGGLLRRIMRTKWLISALLAVVMLPLVTGCYGNFKVTKAVYDWNGQVENRYARSAVMVCMLILPVYEFAALGDIIIFQPVKFWTGDDLDISAMPQPDGAEVVMEPTEADTLAMVTISDDG